MCNEKGAIGVRQRLIELRLPMRKNRTGPVLLFHDRRGYLLAYPVSLPMLIGRAIQTRNDKRLDHNRLITFLTLVEDRRAVTLRRRKLIQNLPER
ncbi:hypothetical protein D3C87_1593480 [compost metagenome]